MWTQPWNTHSICGIPFLGVTTIMLLEWNDGRHKSCHLVKPNKHLRCFLICRQPSTQTVVEPLMAKSKWLVTKTTQNSGTWGVWTKERWHHALTVSATGSSMNWHITINFHKTKVIYASSNFFKTICFIFHVTTAPSVIFHIHFTTYHHAISSGYLRVFSSWPLPHLTREVTHTASLQLSRYTAPV